MQKRGLFGLVLVGLLLAGGGCAKGDSVGSADDLSAWSIAMPNVTLSKDNVFTIDRVVAKEDGWVVIQNEINAKRSQVLGFAPVKAGENKNVTIKVNRDDATAQEYVSLYSDIGQIGTFEQGKSEESAFISVINEKPALDKDGQPVMLKFVAEVE